MAIDPAKFREYTDPELLTLYRSALAAIATGQSYTINGRALSRADLSSVRDTISWLESRIDIATGDGDVGLASFDDPASQGTRRFDRRQF